MKDRFLFLGTGGSTGIPVIGCKCKVCTSLDVHNKRLRPSGLLTIDGKNLLIDATPDLREQAIRYQIGELEGVVLTHAHYDHIGGLDELRAFYLLSREAVLVLASEITIQSLQYRLPYLFREKNFGESLPAQLRFQALQEKRGETSFAGFSVSYMTFEHGGMEVTGFRFGSFAYLSDIRLYPETIFQDLKGVRTLVISALKHTPSPMHLSVDEAIAFSKNIGAETTWFTHLSHDLEHNATNSVLPKGFALAYDGLSIEI